MKIDFIKCYFWSTSCYRKKDAFAVTKKCKVYYLKLKNGICIFLIDTPGLSNADIVCNNKKDLDNIHLKGIEKTISE